MKVLNMEKKISMRKRSFSLFLSVAVFFVLLFQIRQEYVCQIKYRVTTFCSSESTTFLRNGFAASCCLRLFSILSSFSDKSILVFYSGEFSLMWKPGGLRGKATRAMMLFYTNNKTTNGRRIKPWGWNMTVVLKNMAFENFHLLIGKLTLPSREKHDYIL